MAKVKSLRELKQLKAEKAEKAERAEKAEKAARFMTRAELIEKGKNAKQPEFAGRERVRYIGEPCGVRMPGGTYVYPGDEVIIDVAGGGGYGDPFERDPELVENDVADGYVSVENAKKDYGVVIDPETVKADPKETAELRGSLKRA